MRNIKVMNAEEVIKHTDDLFGPIKERIIDMVTGTMRGMKASLEAELSGIALLVMEAVMELEIAQIAGIKHQHQNNREYTRWRKNPGSVVIDGSKALRRAVEDVFGKETPVQRCTVHKKRNVLEQLPEQYHRDVSRRMTRAYNLVSEDEARKELSRLAEDLEALNPSAARSLLEGLEETLTLHRLGTALRKTLRSTNLIESAIAVVRQRTRNVKRWQTGQQMERWVAAGLIEAEKNFRRIKGYGALKQLVDAVQSMRTQQGQAA